MRKRQRKKNDQTKRKVYKTLFNVSKAFAIAQLVIDDATLSCKVMSGELHPMAAMAGHLQIHMQIEQVKAACYA